jgi:preprotein translocase subunit SecE
MNRSLRRHPVEAKPVKRPVTRAPMRPSVQRPSGAGRRGPIPSLPFVADIVAELKKVTWPTWETTIYLTFVVIVVSAVMGLVLGGVDAAFSWLIQRLLFQ